MEPAAARPPILAGTLLALAAVLALLWAASLFWVVSVPVPGGTVRLCYGGVDYFSPPTDPPGFSVTRFPAYPPAALPAWGTICGGPYVVVPLWLPAVAAAAVGVALVRVRTVCRPATASGAGTTCGGNVSGRCPECGAAVGTTG